MVYILELFIIISIIFLITGIIYLKTGLFKVFFHDILEWHMPNNSRQYYDGCNIHCVCRHCKCEIIQDSQGNWFRA